MSEGSRDSSPEVSVPARYIGMLVGVAVLCAGAMTWMTRSCAASPPPATQTSGGDLRATLTTLGSDALRLEVVNETSQPLKVAEPQLWYSVSPMFYDVRNQPLEMKNKIALSLPDMGDATRELGPGETISVDIHRSSLARVYDIPPFTWIALRYQGAEGSEGVVSNAVR